MNQLKLPKTGGELYKYSVGKASSFQPPKANHFEKRIAFSAAHVVADPFAGTDPLHDSQVDWEETMKYRHHLWSHGLGVAEAMDTAQRGMGLNWEQAK